LHHAKSAVHIRRRTRRVREDRSTDSRYLAEGRQLFLSSFPVDVPVFPVNYDNCHLMNARNEALCQRARGEDGQPRPSILLPGGAGAKPPVVVQERKTA
jgi:hypothetical protein